MIGYLKGKVISAKPTKILLDVNGVGYNVFISFNTYEFVSQKEFVELFIFTNVREDAIHLFGFSTETEKEMFELLISVNGIGPKIALSILSGIRIDDLKQAILSADLSRLSLVPGIGKKTGERMVIELRSKVELVQTGVVSVAAGIMNEALSALNTLGFNPKVAEKTVRDILMVTPDADTETIIKKALSNLTR